MRVLINKVKYIALVLTLMNLCLSIFGLHEGESIFLIGGIFIAVELAVLLMYLIMVTHKWSNDQTERKNNEYRQETEELTKRMSILESSLSQMKFSVDEELKKNSLEASLRSETIERIMKDSFDELSNELLSISDSFELSLEKTNSGIVKSQEEIIESLEKTDSGILKSQEEIIESLEKVNTEVLKSQEEIIISMEKSNLGITKDHGEIIESLEKIGSRVIKNQEGVLESLEKVNSGVDKNQEEIIQSLEIKSQNIAKELQVIKQEIDTKAVVHEESLKSILSTTIHNQQKTNTLIEGNNKKATEISSDVIKVIEKRAININYNLNKQLNVTYDRLDALMSIHNLIELNAPLPIMHEWRVSSDFAHSLLTNLAGKKGSVIDIGSGISTLLMGYALKQNGEGKVISLEHDKGYYDKTLKLIKEHKLEEWCEVKYCPLKTFVLDNKDWLWYDIDKVNFPKDIILISADGPPGATQHLARYPALPLLSKYISKRTVIMLDDGDREEEKEIAEKWSKEFELERIKHNSHKGFFELKFIDQ